MAVIALSGEPGCRHEEVARIVAQHLGFEFANEARLLESAHGELGGGVPDKAHGPMCALIVARLAVGHRLVVAAMGAEFLPRGIPGVLRARLIAPPAWRVGALMIDRRLDRTSARALLRELDATDRMLRKRRFGRAGAPAYLLDIVVNTESVDAEGAAAVVVRAAEAKGIPDAGLLAPAAEAQVEFQARLQLSRYGVSAPGAVELKKSRFVHPSEEIFANLLDFYRIEWQYEPKSFPLQWDKDGRPIEAFTPDFYLPEFDLYVELTTMKQSLVTKKNRKVKLLRQIYPHINIQVYYQKDLQDLVLKHGLAERSAKV